MPLPLPRCLPALRIRRQDGLRIKSVRMKVLALMDVFREDRPEVVSHRCFFADENQAVGVAAWGAMVRCELNWSSVESVDISSRNIQALAKQPPWKPSWSITSSLYNHQQALTNIMNHSHSGKAKLSCWFCNKWLHSGKCLAKFSCWWLNNEWLHSHLNLANQSWLNCQMRKFVGKILILLMINQPISSNFPVLRLISWLQVAAFLASRTKRGKVWKDFPPRPPLVGAGQFPPTAAVPVSRGSWLRSCQWLITIY